MFLQQFSTALILQSERIALASALRSKKELQRCSCIPSRLSILKF